MAGERGFALLVRATRAKVVPVMLVPVAVGSALAWSRTGVLSWPRLVLALVGASAATLGANVLTDMFDEDSGAEDAARRDHRSLATGSGVLGAGAMSRLRLAALAGGLLAIAAAAWGVASLDRTVLVFVAGAGAAALAVARSAPPIRYGYRGLGDAGVFAAFGLLPAVASYAAQAGAADSGAWWGGVVPGLLVVLPLYHEQFLHWRSDQESGRRTAVAALGPDAGLAAGRILAIAYVVVVCVQSLVFGLWPPGGALAALAVAPIVVAQSRAAEEPELSSYVRLLGAALGAALLGGAILVVALAIRVALR